MFLKSWLKVLERLDQQIGAIKTKTSQKSYHQFTYLQRKRPRYHQKPTYVVYQLTADCQDHDKKETQSPRQVRFDTDAKKLRVDNCASRCMSSYIEDFVDVPKPTNETIKGLTGTAKGNKEGTIEWKIEDDDGKVHTVRQPRSLYVPEANIGLKQPKITNQTTGEPGREHIMIVLSYGGISASTNALYHSIQMK